MKLSITKYIILFLFLPLATTLIGQGNGKIVGTILSDVDEKLIGVNVALENTTKGTTTDLDGKFVIDNLAPGKYTLVFSSVGFEKNQRIHHPL